MCVNKRRKQPVIYEINTWVWLDELEHRYQRPLTLKTIPPEEWDALGDVGIDIVWFMGVWERSPAGTRIARQMPEFQTAYREALPDYSNQDVVGSPYAVHRYVVDEHLGGPDGLENARSALAQRGIGLILDFVPNHVARDHPWVMERPEYFIQGDGDDLRRAPDSFFEAGGKIIACGRDPHFPPWTDTAQLNAFHPELRAAAAEVLSGMAHQCDGVRCDMAMLPMSRVFERTWGKRAGKCPESQYWREVIQAVRQCCPDFLFLGEVYWDLEWELQQQGFDYCYDKRLYDRLVQGEADGIWLHLLGDISYQQKLVRFIENHDERHAADVFAARKLFVAALTVSSLPGATLFHEGQFEGRRVKLPVQLGRRPREEINQELQVFYRRLLQVVRAAQFREADWQLCELIGWPDNLSYRNLIAWCWSKPKERHIIVVNFSNEGAQARVRLPWADLAGRTLQLTDLFGGNVYSRDGNELLNLGLYVDLDPWSFHFLLTG